MLSHGPRTSTIAVTVGLYGVRGKNNGGKNKNPRLYYVFHGVLPRISRKDEGHEAGNPGMVGFLFEDVMFSRGLLPRISRD